MISDTVLLKMSGRTVLLVLSINLVGITLCESSGKSVQKPECDPQATFSWRFYRESLDLSKNAACSPFAIRMLFAALENLASPFPYDVKTLYDQQMKQVFDIRDLNVMTRRYRKQLKEFKQDTAIKILSFLAAIGDGKLSGAVKHAAKNFQFAFGRFGNRNIDVTTKTINKVMGNLTLAGASNFLDKSDLDSAVQLLVLSQLGFNGIWRKRFQTKWKVTCPFYLNSVRSAPVEFLVLEDYLPYFDNATEDISAVELSFEKKSYFSCLLIKPITGSREGLISKLDHSLFRKIYNNLNRHRKVLVKVPKFTISDKVKAKTALMKMGLNLPFNEDVYRLYADNRRVPLDNLIQRTYFTFGEEGEETAPVILDRSMPYTFAAHQPFLFVIFERTTEVPIVIGHYVQPDKSEVSSAEINPLQCENPPRGFKAG